MTHTATIMRERNLNGNDVECEVEIEVEYTYHRARRGARDSLCGKRGAGPPLEPDEPAEIEIDSVTDATSGEELELTNAEQDRIRDEIIEKLGEESRD